MKTFDEILAEYKEAYDVESLASPNDRANLDMLINNKLLIERLQEEVQTLMAGELVANLSAIEKLQRTIQAAIEQSIAIERTLGIDRKTRKKDNQEDVGAYIAMIKSKATEFLEKQLIYVYCENCKVMCGRVLPAHDHTEFEARFRCTQCKKMAIVKRNERDVFFDVKGNNGWRKAFPVEVEQPLEKAMYDGDDVEVIDDSESET